MTDAQELAALLAAVYAFECVVHVPSNALVLRRDGPSSRIVRAPVWGEFARGGFVLDDVIPPLGGHALLQPWTISMSTEGVVADAGDAAPLRFVKWQHVGTPRSEGGDVVGDRGVIARLASAAAAGHAAAALAAIAAAPPADREKAIDAAIDVRLDADAVAARDAEVRRAVVSVRISAHLVFFAALGLVLSMAGVPWMAAWWPWLLLALVPAMVWTLRDFASAHRRLHPGEDAARRRALWLMGISPLGAIRAAAVACRHAFAAFDPVAVAAALCDDERFREAARRSLAELRHPEPSDVYDDVRRCEDWFRGRMSQRIERLLRSRGVDPDELLAPPPKSGDTIRGFCPRCRIQYERADGACADCRGVPIRPY